MNFTDFAFSKGYLFHESIKDLIVSEHDTVSMNEMSPELIQFQAELMRFGYMLDKSVMFVFNKVGTKNQWEIIDTVIKYLSNTYGDGHFVSLFGNFPYTVLDMTVERMFVNQIFHYLSNGEYVPEHDVINNAEDLRNYRKECFKDEYKVISFANTEKLCELYRTVCSAQQSLASFDKDAVEYAAKNYRTLKDGLDPISVFGSDIPFKETLCIIATNCPDYKLKTVTDVLRTVAYMSGLDVALTSLPTAKSYGWEKYMNSDYYQKRVKELRSEYNFRKFNRTERKEILYRLENVLKTYCVGNNADNVLAEFKIHLGSWIRLGEILHPGEYKNRFSKCCEIFTILRNSGQYILTFNGKVVSARKAGNFEELIRLYSSRPGEFARNIDWLLRNYPEKYMDTLTAFKDKAVKTVSTKLLYELIEHFYTRNCELDRYVFVKGSRQAYMLDKLPKINDTTVEFLLQILFSELAERMSKKDNLEGFTYYLDERLSDIALPKNMRSMNIMPGQVSRGSKFAVKTDTGIFRMYCRWMDPYGKYDLDLSVTMLDKDFKYKGSISWNTDYKIKNNSGHDTAVFSGDVRHRRGNCAEYIDVDIRGMREMGVHYLVSTVCDYDGQGFDKKDAWCGVMEREKLSEPGIVTWAPDTITAGFKLTSKCTNIVMTVVDLTNMTMYLVDEDMDGIPVANTKNGVNKIGLIAKRYAKSYAYFNAYSLIKFNLESRHASVIKTLPAEQLTSVKESIETKIIELKSKIAKLDEDLSKDSSDTISFIMSREKSRLTEELDELQHRVFITYDNIAKDYTTLFDWMF